MTSKIVVNNIEADSGINTVTFNSNISVSTATITNVNATRISGVSTAGITTVYTNSFNGGQLGGSRNIIINGSMVVNQRGFTGAAGTTTNQTYTTDRFRIDVTHDGAVSAGQTSMNSTIGGNAYTDGFQNALILRVTTADSSLAAAQYQLITQPVEGYNLQGIKKGTANAQPVTLSFWVRSSTTGTYICELLDNDNTRQVSQSYTINAANTWEKKALVFPADTTGFFDNDNNVSLYVNWWLAAGSTFSGGTLNTSWAANTNANRVVGQTNLLATAGNDFFLTGVQLEVGDRATEFERRSYGDELRLCQRYYYRVDAVDFGGGGPIFGSGTNNSTTVSMIWTPFAVPMRTSPSSIDTTGTASNYSVIHANTSTTCSSVPVIDDRNRYGCRINLTVASGLTAGQGSFGRLATTGTSYIGFNAEL